MKSYKRIIIILIIVTLIITVFLSYYSYYRYTHLTNAFVSNVVEVIDTNYPDVDMTTIIDIINSSDYTTSDILTNYGFTENDISILSSLKEEFTKELLINISVFVILTAIFIIIIIAKEHKNKKNLNDIISYLKELNRGNYNLFIDLNKEGELSILKNEIYTTTVMLRKQAEKELQDKINLKDSLTNISHQLKTPLTSISLLVDNLLDEEIDTNTQKEFLLDIKKQIESINYLIIVLLKLSRFDANVVTFKEEKINVKNLLIDILKHIDIIREVKNIDIQITGDNASTLIGDYKWEYEAISNILKNCLEYTPENKNIYIKYRETNMYTEIIIEDEGPGMSKNEKNKIFERFYKGNNSNSNNFGIGLSLAKEIINKDNGKIKVESELNKGTTFKIHYYK